MKKHIRNINVFLDANVIIDYMLPRKHHSKNAASLFDEAKKVSVYVCSFTFAIVYHHMRKKNISHSRALHQLEQLFQKVVCLSVNDEIIQKALKSGFNDFEDAIQYFCALQVPNCEAIISRDRRGFHLSAIPAISPNEFLSKEF